jgi:tetratricopeptide (TPR) repeat protein/DNA-binding CsgD family transcriptional regulator
LVNKMTVLSLLSLVNYGILSGQSPGLKSNSTELIEQIRHQNPKKYRDIFPLIEQDLITTDDYSGLIRLYNMHSDNLFNHGSYDSAMLVLYKVKSIIPNSESFDYAKLCFNIATIHHFHGNLDSFNHWYHEGRTLASHHKDILGDILMLESLDLSHKGEFKESAERLIKAIGFYQKAGNEESLAVAYQNLALVYGNIGDREAQIEYHNYAIEILEKLNLNYRLVENYNALGSVMRALDLPEEALRYYDLVYERLLDDDYPFILAQNLTNRANILEKMGSYNEAEKLFKECKKISELNNIQYGVMLSDLNLGNLYRLKKQYIQSEQYLQKALQGALGLKVNRDRALTYERLAWLERDRGNYKSALEYQTQYYLLNDSLAGEAVKKEIFELKQKYESEKKENQILALSKNRMYLQYTVGMLVILLIILMLLILWLKTRSKLKQQEQLKKEQYLRFELKLKQKELLTESITKISVSNIKDHIMEKIEKIIKDLPNTQSRKFQSLLHELGQNRDQNILEEFEARFVGVYESFFDNLKSLAPQITPTELRIAALIRLNLSTKEIASLTFRSTGTIDNVRSSLRRKLQMAEDENLIEKLSKL